MATDTHDPALVGRLECDEYRTREELELGGSIEQEYNTVERLAQIEREIEDAQSEPMEVVLRE